jgi:hypothetical protein
VEDVIARIERYGCCQWQKLETEEGREQSVLQRERWVAAAGADELAAVAATVFSWFWTR